jgi:mRNA-degrading endonuclease toxin of MazEF toxin-antitoxin module
MPPRPGEVWLADLGLAAKTRPVVIVSRDDPDPPRALILYVPLTTQNRQSPYEVVLPACHSWPPTLWRMCRVLVPSQPCGLSADSVRCRKTLWSKLNTLLRLP